MDKNGILFTYKGNFRALKILIGANYSSTVIDVASSFNFGETNKTERFISKFGTPKVPTYESKDGKVTLNESDAILFYVANEQLRGKDDVSKAKILQWMSFAQTQLESPIFAWLFPCLSIIQFNKDQVQKAKLEVERLLHYLDNHLMTHTYLVGECITLADISIFSVLFDAFKHLIEEDQRKLFFNLTRWFDTILNQKKVKEVMSQQNFEFAYCKSALKFDPTKFKEFSGTQCQQKTKKEKCEKKKDEKPSESSKAQEKTSIPENEMDETEEAIAAEPKVKDPLDALPKGKWIMDDFKRFYSNNDTDKSIPYFWEHFDPEHYSIWFGEYKYNEELTKVFMSCNLISGMYQRLDKLRKNAFASVVLFGEDNNSSISGVWVFRGQELAFTLNPDWQVDYETYEWKKLDPADSETKKAVANYFSWEGTDKQGRRFNQGKIFK